jgi:hypothetical protein
MMSRDLQKIDTDDGKSGAISCDIVALCSYSLEIKLAEEGSQSVSCTVLNCAVATLWEDPTQAAKPKSFGGCRSESMERKGLGIVFRCGANNEPIRRDPFSSLAHVGELNWDDKTWPAVKALFSCISCPHSARSFSMATSEPHPILDRLSAISQLIRYSLRPLPPRYGDGRYDSDVSPAEVKTGLLKDLTSQALRVPADIELISEAISTVFLQGGLQDDSKYFVEPQLVFTDHTDGEDYSIRGIASDHFQTPGNAHLWTHWQSLEHPPPSALVVRRRQVPVSPSRRLLECTL